MTAPITINTLTEASINGNGVFDTLMRAMKEHLEQEFRQGRIKGSEYANVYLGSVQAVMQTALQFVVQQTELNQNILLKEKQIELAAVEVLKAQAQVELINAQVTNAVTENAVLVAQECKLRAEYDVLMESKLKTAAEIGLLNQKKVTEQGQVSGSVFDANSILGVQAALYKAQANGFKRDAEQKAADIMVKAWATARTTDPDNTPMIAGVDTAVNKLLAGI